MLPSDVQNFNIRKLSAYWLMKMGRNHWSLVTKTVTIQVTGSMLFSTLIGLIEKINSQTKNPISWCDTYLDVIPPFGWEVLKHLQPVSGQFKSVLLSKSKFFKFFANLFLQFFKKTNPLFRWKLQTTKRSTFTNKTSLLSSRISE